jgi:hypothetical protein
VVDGSQKPLGLLYRQDLNNLNNQDERLEDIDEKNLEERIKKITEDFVTHRPWNNKTTGVKNYAELLLTGNLQVAQSAMQAKADGPKVRGVVLDMQGKVKDIVDYT